MYICACVCVSDANISGFKNKHAQKKKINEKKKAAVLFCQFSTSVGKRPPRPFIQLVSLNRIYGWSDTPRHWGGVLGLEAPFRVKCVTLHAHHRGRRVGVAARGSCDDAAPCWLSLATPACQLLATKCSNCTLTRQPL